MATADSKATLNTVSRKTSWVVPPDAPRTADDLPFTSRDEKGFIRWWDVTPPNTEYCHPHDALGRAYAFELLDLLNNPKADDDKAHYLRFISGAITRWRSTVSGGAAESMADGFFDVIGEFLTTGTARR
jgi:hypothetical protein